jgi:HlyD family secretion protein
MVYKNDVLNVDPAADADSRVVEVRVRLDRSDLAAGLVNMQAEVQIFGGGAGTDRGREPAAPATPEAGPGRAADDRAGREPGRGRTIRTRG